MIIIGSARQRGTFCNAPSPLVPTRLSREFYDSVGFPQFVTGVSKGIGSGGNASNLSPHLSTPEKTPEFWAALCVAGALVPQEGPIRQCRADSL
jgi:hypothetical protein